MVEENAAVESNGSSILSLSLDGERVWCRFPGNLRTEDPNLYVWTVVIVLSFLIAVSVLFELGKDWVEEVSLTSAPSPTRSQKASLARSAGHISGT